MGAIVTPDQRSVTFGATKRINSATNESAAICWDETSPATQKVSAGRHFRRQISAASAQKIDATAATMKSEPLIENSPSKP